MIAPVSLFLVMPLSNDFIMKLNVAYNFESTCPINLVLEIYNLHEQSLCDNKNDNSCLTIFGVMSLSNDFNMKLNVAYNIKSLSY